MQQMPVPHFSERMHGWV